MVSRWRKTAALSVSVLCAAVNLSIAFQFFSLWRASKRDTATESEGLAGGWARGLSTLGGLATVYFLTAAAANVVGLVGILKRYPRCVRFWRDFSIADFACTTTTTVFAVYAASRYYDLRNDLCEELSRHDDVMMDLAELGITLENCEQWSQRAILAVVSLLVFLHLIRLHLVITVSKIFARMSTHTHHRRASSMQRIYLLPSMPGASSPALRFDTEQGVAGIPAVVYAPVPLSQLSERDVRELSAREAWISSGPMSPRSHVHPSAPGRIGLPIVPGEGLLPSTREK
ncbi:hypothetical protein K488DRAFT_41958 [Vararia minispora EC-137]|uniref:Uncharacterized protein n=1 Tax=Vararia minispora EC-137 TaxID=1314806 RepID=A0ACB8QX40_9AGAM|nr:hypothetical protein K488DRAFT_41958 [Vararia minispora EC-137]